MINLFIDTNVFLSFYHLTKLVTNILRSVGEAKRADDETRRLPPFDAPVVISGPRRDDPGLMARRASRSLPSSCAVRQDDAERCEPAS
jgi:hypothetical protein